jgi:hypothetical protein
MAQICVLCGMPSMSNHPWVGVGRKDLKTNEGPMVPHPVCHPCFSNPEHRVVQGAKLHYHAAGDARIAANRSNDLDAVSKAGGDLNL